MRVDRGELLLYVVFYMFAGNADYVYCGVCAYLVFICEKLYVFMVFVWIRETKGMSCVYKNGV